MKSTTKAFILGATSLAVAYGGYKCVTDPDGAVRSVNGTVKGLITGLQGVSARLEPLERAPHAGPARRAGEPHSPYYWKGVARRAEERAREEASRADESEKELRIERQQAGQRQQDLTEQRQQEQPAPVSTTTIYVNQVVPGAYEVFTPWGYAPWFYGSPAYLRLWLAERFWGLGYRFYWCDRGIGWRPDPYYRIFRSERHYAHYGWTQLRNGRRFYLSQYDYNHGAAPHAGYFDPAPRARGGTAGSRYLLGTGGRERLPTGPAAGFQDRSAGRENGESRVRGLSPQPGNRAFQNRADRGLQRFVPQARRRAPAPYGGRAMGIRRPSPQFRQSYGARQAPQRYERAAPQRPQRRHE